jgi:hypothetical protein
MGQRGAAGFPVGTRMNHEALWGTWAWICPECAELYFLPIHSAPVMYYRGEEPRRPEFDLQKVPCCGKIYEITPTNIEWAHIANYSPALQ